jgi:hypothetical protein
VSRSQAHRSAMTSPAKVKGLHWYAPCLAISCLLAGVLLAAGHDKFYTSLHDERTSDHRVMRNQFSGQQFNLAIGTTFAFLVRSALALSVSVAFCQLIWRVTRQGPTTKHRPTLERLDAAYSATTNIFNMFHLPLWYRYPLLCSIALVSW